MSAKHPTHDHDPPPRQTRQRRAIHHALEHAGRPLSPAEILDAARADVEGLGLATVYRTLKTMTDDGTLIAVDIPGESPRYELAGKGHHHHFHCRSCERVFEVEGCPGALDELTPAGFVLEGHDVTLHGLCVACVKKPKRGR